MLSAHALMKAESLKLNSTKNRAHSNIYEQHHSNANFYQTYLYTITIYHHGPPFNDARD